jgi:hypothetical protein
MAADFGTRRDCLRGIAVYVSGVFRARRSPTVRSTCGSGQRAESSRWGDHRPRVAPQRGHDPP